VVLQKFGCIDLIFAISFLGEFWYVLIVADGFQDMLINFVLQSQRNSAHVPSIIAEKLIIVARKNSSILYKFPTN